MLRLVAFSALLIGSCGYAILRGRHDERFTALVCLAASVASIALTGPTTLRYSQIELGVLAVDLLTLAAFTHVALRSDRFWPLWISGLQLTTSIAHLLKAAEPGLVPLAYAAAGRFWAYPILIMLVIATWRSNRRGRIEASDFATAPLERVA
jgi:hypothetical protein